MGTVIGKRKKKMQYGDKCLPIDVIRQGSTIRTFDKGIWVNCWNGRFGRLSIDDESIEEIQSLHDLFQRIQTVAKNDRVIARKSRPDQVLRFVQRPYRIGKQK